MHKGGKTTMNEWKLETVTPAKAKAWLELNKVNRPVSRGTVEAYANDMKNGRWDVDTDSAISFNKSGLLVNGQHRLNAIILADVPVTMWIRRGVGDHVVFDSGRNRQMTDYMKIEHPDLPSYYHNNKVLSMIKFLVISTRGETRARMSQHECEDFIAQHRDDLDTFFSVINPHTVAPKITITLNFLSLFMAYKAGVDLSELSRFWTVLTSGMSEGPKDFPVIAYRNYLLNRDSTAHVDVTEIKKCQGAIKKYLTSSGLKRVYEPKELIWDYPYKNR